MWLTEVEQRLSLQRSYNPRVIELHALNYHVTDGTQLLVGKLSHSLSETLFSCQIILTSEVLLKCYHSNVVSELMSECVYEFMSDFMGDFMGELWVN